MTAMPSGWFRWAAGGGLAALVLGGAGRIRADEAAPTVLVAEDFAASDLASTANGQSVRILDPRTGAIVALDPAAPDKRRCIVGPAPKDGPQPVAIGCIDTTTVAAVCRSGATWSLRAWGVHPREVAEFTAPRQEIVIGTAAEAGAVVHLLVAPSRKWLAAVGLPAPLAPFLRAAIAGVRAGGLSARGCPAGREGTWVAVAATPLDEAILFDVRAAGTSWVSYHGLAGDLLLELECGVPAIRDAACGADGTVWVVGGDRAVPERPEGLWRLDAVAVAGRQVVRPVCVARLDGPGAVACLGGAAVVVAHGPDGGRLVRYDHAPRRAAPPGPEARVEDSR